jgi:PAS domain S-box-containing protein
LIYIDDYQISTQEVRLLTREQEEDYIRELLVKYPKGLTIEEVSKKLSLNRTTAAKYLNAFVLTGQADMRTLGSAKLFYLTERVPLTNVLSLSSDLILILDKDLFIQEINTAFLEYFNLDKQDLREKQLSQSTLAQHFSARELSCIERALDGEGGTREIQFDLLHDGRFFKMKCIPLTFESGARAVGIILEDITEMKTYQHELEQRVQERTTELRESQRALSTLMGNLPGMAYKCRNDNPWTMEFVSEGCADLTGYQPSDLTGESAVTYASLIHPQDRKAAGEQIRKATEGHEKFQVMYRIHTATGIEKWVWEQGLGVFSPEGVLLAVEGFITDITDRKNAEEIIKKANKQVSLLTSITRHDIINQINSLQGYISILKKRNADPQNADVLKKIKEIADMILRQIVFTRDYQNVGAEPPRWIPIRKTLKSLLQTVDLESARITIDTGDLEIYADPLTEKVFFNLVDNSLRHGEHVTRIRISCEEKDNHLDLVYEDDGVGIADDEKEKIFIRGFGKNTGYGLFLIREILAITGFTILENGTPGQGARFVIRIPKTLYRLPEHAGTSVI